MPGHRARVVCSAPMPAKRAGAGQVNRSSAAEPVALEDRPLDVNGCAAGASPGGSSTPTSTTRAAMPITNWLAVARMSSRTDILGQRLRCRGRRGHLRPPVDDGSALHVQTNAGTKCDAGFCLRWVRQAARGWYVSHQLEAEQARAPGCHDQTNEADDHLAAGDWSFIAFMGLGPVVGIDVGFERGGRPFPAVRIRALAYVTPIHGAPPFFTCLLVGRRAPRGGTGTPADGPVGNLRG